MPEARVTLLTLLTLMLACGGAALTAAAPADGPPTGELTIHASGFANARGHAVARLFVPGDDVLKPGRWQRAETIDGGAAVFRFPALPAGRYALVVFHDQNDNLALDHGLLGPTEPLGFSGGFELSLFSGRPDFERLQFEFRPPAQALRVSVK